MPDVINKDNAQKEKLSFFENLMEIAGWIQIVFSPLLAGIIVGALVYLAIGGTAGIILAILVSIIGLITGIVWANKIRKKTGTMHFISRVNASPELDSLDAAPKEDKQHTI